MEELIAINPDEQRFIEAIGLHFEALGVSRIGGRIVALLVIAPRPLTLEEIADLLLVSRASISTNTRQFLQLGIIEPHSIPGDRRNYYTFASHAWEHRLHVVRASAAELRRLMTMGRAAVSEDNASAIERLNVAVDFGAFLEGEATTMMTRWRQVQRARKGDAE